MWFLKPGCEDPARPGPAGRHTRSPSLTLLVPVVFVNWSEYLVLCAVSSSLAPPILLWEAPPVHQGRLVQMCRRSTQPRFSPAGKKVTTSHGISSHATNKADHHGPTRETRLARRPDMTYLIRDG
jgi:hypothetical protein